MNIRHHLAFLTAILFGVSFVAQAQDSESGRLTTQMLALFRSGDFEGALKAGERVLELQTKSSTRNPLDISAATMNLVRVQKAYLEHVRKNKEGSGVPAKRRLEIYREFPTRIEELSIKAIQAYQQAPRDAKAVASLQVELATFIVEQDEISTARGEKYVKAQRLFDEAIANLAEHDKHSDEYLAGLLASANFFQSYAEFERSLPLYSEFINGASVKLGVNSPVLVHPLFEIAQIHRVIGEAAQADAYLNRASQIPNSTVTKNIEEFDLSRRGSANLVAELARDPKTITTYMKKLKSIFVSVEIDESGKVTVAKSEPNTEIDIFGKPVPEYAEKLALSLNFKPLKINGVAKQMRGRILIPYFVRS